MLARDSRQLTTRFIRSIDRTGRFGDGRGSHGLSIRAERNAAGGLNKFWQQRTSINGQKCTIGLGTFPIITLQVARNRAFDNARKIALGEDIRKPERTIPTFAQAFDQVIETRYPSWRDEDTVKAWRRGKEFCKPMFSTKVSKVTTKDILDTLEPIWISKPKVARDLRSILSGVMDWTIQQGHRTTDPVPTHAQLTRTFGNQPPPVPHKSAPYDDLGSHLETLICSDTWWAEKYCILFMALTADRSGEARKAVWSEIDLDKAIWTIPGHRMKNAGEHIVPLSKQAIEILKFAQRNGDHSKGTIFPPKRGGIYINRSRLAKTTQKLALPFVPHGLRASFATWASDREYVNPDVVEASLAHAMDKKVRRPYIRTKFFKQRRKLMQEWADFLTETMGPVIAGAPRPKGDPPKIKSKDEPATGAEPHIAAVPGTDQQAGKPRTPENGTTATNAGQATKRRHPAQALATVNGRPPKGPKQRTKAFHQPGLQFVETRP